jgi:hypothetical protein
VNPFLFIVLPVNSFTLGSDFQHIQNNHPIGLLPEEWKTTDWPTLLVLCRNYSNSVRPQGNRQDNSDSSNISSVDRPAHHKKIKQWFMNPVKFKAEIEAEQAKYIGKCIYHLSKSHLTCDCYIKKECDKLIAARKIPISNASPTTTSTGQLRNIKEEEVEESIPEESNDTSKIDLYYFARIKNHYLRLVRSLAPVSMSSRHTMKFPIIADSGANHHMFKEKVFFSSMTPRQGQVVLGDGKTRLKIQGIGTVNCVIEGHPLTIPDVRYVPDLAESVYSLLLHIKQPQYGLQSSFEEGLNINFPNFTTKAVIGNDDIYLNATPNLDGKPDLSMSSPVVPHEYALYRNLLSTSDNGSKGLPSPDNILRDLRQYYSTVKTKHQLSMDVPAGFHQSTQLHKDFQQFLPPPSADSSSSTVSKFSNLQSTSDDISTESIVDQSSGSIPKSNLIIDPSPVTNSSSRTAVPIVRCVDKCSTSLPLCITFSEDFIRSSVGFRRVDTLRHHLKDLYQITVKLDSSPPDAILDIGDLATLRKSARNTTPVPRPNTLERLSIWILYLDLMCLLVTSIMAFFSQTGTVG